MVLHGSSRLLSSHLRIGVSLGIVGRLVSRGSIPRAVRRLRNITSCGLLILLIGISCGRIASRLGITVLLRITVSGLVSACLGLCVSCRSIPVLCERSLSRIAGIFRNAGRRLSAGHLRSLVIAYRLVSLHLGIGSGLRISLGIGILLLALVSLLILISLRILIPLLCGISGIGCSAGITSLRISVLLRIPCLIRVLIFLSHIFSFPLGR